MTARIAFPGHPLEGRTPRRTRGARFVPEEVGVEVAPRELAEEALSTLARPSGARRHLCRREQPPAQILAEAGRPVEVQPVAVRRVALKGVRAGPTSEALPSGVLSGDW